MAHVMTLDSSYEFIIDSLLKRSRNGAVSLLKPPPASRSGLKMPVGALGLLESSRYNSFF